MWIKRARFKNFGCHEYEEFDFVQGLTGIFGPNGSGKSTITDGIYAALTGSWERFDGVKTDNIRDLADPAEEAFVEVTAEHEGTSFKIFRGLRPNSNKLWVAGSKKPITKSGDIQIRLKELGVDSKLIGTYVFVSQWNMFDFISQTPGDRAKTYQHLCNTGAAQEIVDAVDKLMEQDQNLSVELVDNSDDIRLEIVDLKSQYSEQRKLYLEWKEQTLSKEVEAEYREALKRRERRREAKDKLPEIRKALKTAKAELEAKNQLLDKEQVVHQRLTASYEQVAQEKGVAEKKLEAWRQYTAYYLRKKKYEDEITQLAETIAAAVAAVGPEPPQVDQKRVCEVRDQLASCRDQISSLEHTITHFEQEGVTNCETCGTLVDDIDLDSLRDSLEEKQQLREMYLKERDQLSATEAKYNNWLIQDRRAHDGETKKEWLKERLAELEVVKKPKGVYDIEVLQATVSQEGLVRSQLSASSAVLTKAKVAQAKAKAEVQHNQKRLTELKQIVEDNPLTKSEWQEAKTGLDQHQTAKNKMEVAKLAGAQVKQSLTSREASLKSLLAKLARNQRALKFAERLKAIKKIFHRQMLPRVVAAENLEDMEAGINEGLETFGDPFYVQATEDLSFDVFFPGAPPKPAARLSGGQKGVLAVVFRREIARLFANELGMMVLDEPTAGMDTTNIACLEAALVRYAAELRGKNQVIMITHSEQLRPAFDQIIELDANG